MKKQDLSLRESLAGMIKTPQVLINMPLSEKLSKEDLNQLENQAKEAEKKLEGQGRILLRPSGTEPLLRVMVEGENLVMIKTIANDLVKDLEASLTSWASLSKVRPSVDVGT